MKKLLSSFLAITIIFSLLSVSVGAFVTQKAVVYSPTVVRLQQDFSDASKTDFRLGTDSEESSGTAEIVSGELKVTNPEFNLGSNLDLGNEKTKYVLEFSVSTENDYVVTNQEIANYSLYWYVPNRGTADGGYGITIPFDSIGTGTVRTYQLVINESAISAVDVCEKAFVKDGDGEFKRLSVATNRLKQPSNRCYVDFAPGYIDAVEYNFYLGGKIFAGGTFDYNMPYEEAPVLKLDDIKVNTYALAQGTAHNVNYGVSYSEDFSSSPSGFTAADIDTVQKTEIDGNKYYTVKPNNVDATTSAWEKNIGSLLLPNTEITFDLRCETEGMPFLLSVGRPETLEMFDSGKGISYGTAVTAAVTFSTTATEDTPQKVEFYVNGNPYSTDTAAPFEAKISGLKVGTSSVMAKIYCTSGLVVQSEPQLIKVDYVKGKAFDVGREYEVDYKYIQGDGSLTINDGYFRLSMKHTGDDVTYTTLKGEETYEGIGDGDYKIVVSAGHAEIYWNGQFLKSIILPFDTSKANMEYSNISDVTFKSSGVKAELLSIDNGGSFESDNIPSTQYYSIEFDKQDSSAEEIHINDGVYSTVLYFRNDGIYAKNQLTGGAAVSEQKLAGTVKTGYYRLTVAQGIAQLTHNNVPIGNFRFVLSGSKPRIKRVVTNGNSSSFLALKRTDDVYYHTENFEGDAELPSEDYWQAGPTNYRSAASENLDAMRQVEANGNHYMKLSGTGIYVLNATDQYPSLKWRGKVDTASGKVFALLRQSMAQQHTKIGYDFDSQSWFFEIMERDGKITNATTASAPNALQSGKWYDFEVVTKDYTVKLLVDGKEVFSKTLPTYLDLIHYGRFGIGVSNSVYSFDDFRYTGKNRVTAGANIFVPLQFTGVNISSDNTYSYVGGVSTFFKDTDGTVYGVAADDNQQANIKSSDNGKTWERAYGGPFKKMTNNYVTMPNGNIVAVVAENVNWNAKQYSMISKDGGKTWNAKTLIHDGTYGMLGTGDRLRCTKDGRIFAVFDSGYEGFTRFTVFYSDDGVNWKKSNPEYITMYETGTISNELMVVDTPRKDEVWLYFRSNTGFVTYYKSFDNGVTFDTTPYFSGLQSVCSTYSIIRDWDTPSTYYAVFMYDTETAHQGSTGSPRNRASMAVSYDGMETWEYVSDLIATNNMPELPMSDLNMYHFRDGYLYWRVNSLQGPGLRQMGVQDISKIKSLKRLPEQHFRYILGYDAMETIAQRQCVVSKTKGISWVYGDYYVSDVQSGRVDISTIEKIFGVTATTSGSTITLTLGGGSVVLTDGSTSYTNNGTKVTAERVVLSGGYADLEILCEIFGRMLRETDTSYCVMDKTTAVDVYQEMIDNLI